MFLFNGSASDQNSYFKEQLRREKFFQPEFKTTVEVLRSASPDDALWKVSSDRTFTGCKTVSANNYTLILFI